MKYLIQFLFLFCGLLASGQQWDPKTAYWIYSADFIESHGDLRVSFLKDTLLQGHNCQMLRKDMIVYSYSNQTYAYRFLGKEVTYYEAGVTYILNDNHEFDTLYYFNGKIGDRYKVTDRLKWHSTDSGYAVIADTGSVVFNYPRIKWQAVDYYLKSGTRQTTLRDTIIERIGATKYYFLPWDYINGQVDANQGGKLACFNDSYLGNYSAPNTTDCTFDLSLIASKRYEPYINESKVWKNVQTAWLTGGSGGPIYNVNQSYFDGVTMVDGFQYHIMYRKMVQPATEGESQVFLMREDTTSQKVYVKDIQFNKSALLYDFKLKKGEKFNSYVIGGIYHPHTVVKADTITLFNRKLKRIVFDDSAVWVEGIGAINESYIPSSGELICVTIDNMPMYLNSKYTKCDTVFAQGNGSAIKMVKDNAFLLYPNPVEPNSMLYAKTKSNEKLRIEIYSITGALIKADEFSLKYPIGSLHLKKGWYLCRISSDRELIQTDKLVVQ